MRNVMGLWRRSIQTRVVASTILLSTLVIGATGWALLSDVADGLADSRRKVAVAEARSGFEVAQAQLDAALESEPETQAQALTQMVDSLTGVRGGRRAYELVLEGPLGGEDIPVRSSAAIAPGSLPGDLRRSVIKSPGTYWRFSDLSVLGQNDRDPAVVVGSRLRAPRTGDTYAMFYLFSMKEQQATLDLVRQALLLGGLAMVLMVAGVAWLVSRQVLNPVRLARRIAERYASGSLEQRMRVSGEDDIARLSTSFNQMAASLQSQIRRLENLSRLQQRFVSDVSHELRTPLTTVQMASSLLFESRERFDPQTARSAELLKSELDRFEELLSNLLDLSRFDAGAAQLELDAVDLAAIARAAADEPQLERHGIEVRLVGTDEPAVVEADIRRIDRIVRNLLTNAAKYSGSPVVEIEVAQDDDHVSLAVRDFGVGLSGDENLRVFDRFWRADPARTQGGTGLGLPISREDAVLHGGSLQAWGRPGEGSEFVLTLPRIVPTHDEQKDGGGGPAPIVPSVFA
ncbi:MtrAB system histidine kinase MtrB [Aeromicrobium sp.]|uniref:MtrAB system histidine kinase MtrB n=1 Tax=Aeromicrobium sp. TaxID=1871063 RepID=UPI003C63F902